MSEQSDSTRADGAPAETAAGGERIAKVIARAGLCSRREAERWITEGRVTLNGRALKDPGTNVTDEDRIGIDGAPLPKPDTVRVWRFHKPVGVLVSDRDDFGRTLLKDILPDGMPRVMAVGRLDINSEGLILLTNDGAVKRRLELPEHGEERAYRVRVYGRVNEKDLARLANGIEIDGVEYGPIRASMESRTGANAWLHFTLTEGKNREIRRVCAHMGLQVSRLIRVSYGGIKLGSLGKEKTEELGKKQLWDAFRIGVEPKAGWAKAKPKTKFKPRSKAGPKSASRRGAPVSRAGERTGGRPEGRGTDSAGGRSAGAATGRRQSSSGGRDAGDTAGRRGAGPARRNGPSGRR